MTPKLQGLLAELESHALRLQINRRWALEERDGQPYFTNTRQRVTYLARLREATLAVRLVADELGVTCVSESQLDQACVLTAEELGRMYTIVGLRDEVECILARAVADVAKRISSGSPDRFGPMKALCDAIMPASTVQMLELSSQGLTHEEISAVVGRTKKDVAGEIAFGRFVLTTWIPVVLSSEASDLVEILGEPDGRVFVTWLETKDLDSIGARHGLSPEEVDCSINNSWVRLHDHFSRK